jgi:hypothetical protein
MTKPILHFAHANGVPSACYQKMLAVLAQDYQVVCIPIIGTDPKYPITNHWFNLAQNKWLILLSLRHKASLHWC